MKISQIFVVVALSIVALVVTTNVPAVRAAASNLGGPQGRLVLRMHHADGSVQSESVTPLAAPGTVSCKGRAENPHHSPSERADSVIFKTRIECHGDGPPVVQIRLTGTLGSVSGAPPPSGPPQGPPVERAKSDQTQDVVVNGGKTTYYTPGEEPGNPKVRGSGWYQGDVIGEVVGPPGNVTFGPARTSSGLVWVNDPG